MYSRLDFVQHTLYYIQNGIPVRTEAEQGVADFVHAYPFRALAIGDLHSEVSKMLHKATPCFGAPNPQAESRGQRKAAAPAREKRERASNQLLNTRKTKLSTKSTSVSPSQPANLRQNFSVFFA